MQTRIDIQNHNENAEILLSDPDGKNRLRLVVDDKGEPSMELLDAKGQVRVRSPGIGIVKFLRRDVSIRKGDRPWSICLRS